VTSSIEAPRPGVDNNKRVNNNKRVSNTSSNRAGACLAHSAEFIVLGGASGPSGGAHVASPYICAAVRVQREFTSSRWYAWCASLLSVLPVQVREPCSGPASGTHGASP
jgi:hypothetical protein